VKLIGHTEITGSAANSIVFNSIPQQYSELYLILNFRGSPGSQGFETCIRFNDATSAYYSKHASATTGSISSGSNAYGPDELYLGNVNGSSSMANGFGSQRVHIPGYSSSLYKVVDYCATGAGSSQYGLIGTGIWESTDSITKIEVGPRFGLSETLLVGSSASLYAITADTFGGTTVS